MYTGLGDILGASKIIWQLMKEAGDSRRKLATQEGSWRLTKEAGDSRRKMATHEGSW